MHTVGRLEVICGPMFSGKSEELIRRLRRAKIAKLNVMSFKPVIDTRYDPLAISSHSQQTIETTPVASCYEIENIVGDYAHSKMWFPDLIAIDEAQFFTDDIIRIVQQLVAARVQVIVAGLDTDSQGHPFGSMPYLMAIADKVLKLSAVCIQCGAPAIHTHRLGASKELIKIGGADQYEARCRKCWNPSGGA